MFYYLTGLFTLNIQGTKINAKMSENHDGKHNLKERVSCICKKIFWMSRNIKFKSFRKVNNSTVIFLIQNSCVYFYVH